MSSEVKEIARALEATVLGGPMENECPTIALLSTYIKQNKSDEARCELLNSLLELFDEDDGDEKKLALFQESSLTLFPLLTPLARSEQVQPVAFKVLSLASEFARPREAIIALGEVLEGLEDQMETFDVSDDGEGFEDEDEDGHPIPGLIRELCLMLDAYRIVIPRLPKKRSTPTILRLSNSLEPLLSVMAYKTTEETSRELLLKLVTFVKACWSWSQDCEDAGGEQQSLLQHTLFVAVTMLGPRVGAGLLERWFLRTFPRYSIAAVAVESDQGIKVLQSAMTACELIGLDSDLLVQTLIHPTSITPHASIASLILLATGVTGTSDEQKLSPSSSNNAMALLQDSMPVLSAALGGSAVDAGAVWAWELLQGSSDSTLDLGAASMLLEILVPLTAMHPSPLSRLAFFKMLSQVCSSVASADDQISLLQQLVEPENPFDEIRLAGVNITREKLSAAADQKLLAPNLIPRLGPCCFQLPPGPEPTLELALQDLLESPWPLWFTECLGLFWVLYVNDSGNLTGVRDAAYIKFVQQTWLDPQQVRLDRLQRELHDDDEVKTREDVNFVIERWCQALLRARGIL